MDLLRVKIDLVCKELESKKKEYRMVKERALVWAKTSKNGMRSYKISLKEISEKTSKNWSSGVKRNKDKVDHLYRKFAMTQ